jgi:hypothetical protein
MGKNLLDTATKAVKWLERVAKQFGVGAGDQIKAAAFENMTEVIKEVTATMHAEL